MLFERDGNCFSLGCSWGGRGQAVCFPGVSLPEGKGGGAISLSHGAFPIDIPGMGGALFSFGFAYQTTRVARLFVGMVSGGLMPWLGYGLLRPWESAYFRTRRLRLRCLL